MAARTGSYRIARGAAGAAFALALSGCGSLGSFGGMFGGSDTAPAAATAQPASQMSAAPAATGAYQIDIDVASECPQVKIANGEAAVTVPPGAGGTENVRYQIAIVDVARECVLEPGNMVLIKVGVRGVVTLGSKGSPGSFGAPLKYTVLDRSEAVIATEMQKVGATVGADGQPARFQTVSTKIRVPISPSKPLRGYDIYVGMNSKG